MNWSRRRGFCRPTPNRYVLVCWTFGCEGHVRKLSDKAVWLFQRRARGLKEVQVARIQVRKCPRAAQQRVKSRVAPLRQMNKACWRMGELVIFLLTAPCEGFDGGESRIAIKKGCPGKERKIQTPFLEKPMSKTCWTCSRFGHFSAGCALQVTEFCRRPQLLGFHRD